jgi:hypothetical protein
MRRLQVFQSKIVVCLYLASGRAKLVIGLSMAANHLVKVGMVAVRGMGIPLAKAGGLGGQTYSPKLASVTAAAHS